MDVDSTSSATSSQQAQDPSTSTGMVSTSGEHLDDFLNTGRTGRRNAVPDIGTDPGATVSTADLPKALDKLSCNDPPGETSGASGSQQK